MKTTTRVSAILVGYAIAAAGCSGSGTTGTEQQSNSGGNGSLGGANMGGKAGVGGGSGGNIAPSGGQNLGGSSSAAGGATATGGQTSAGGGIGAGNGGTVTAGGNSAAGGKAAVGGASASGGTKAVGGASPGGNANTGGTASNVGGGATVGGRAGAGGAATGGTTSNAGASSTIAKPTFDWVGVIGSGQSLAVGFTPPNLTTAYYNNLMLKLGSTSFPSTGTQNPTAPVPGTSAKPWDTTLADLTMVPLIEPLRAEGSGYPRPYPINLWGETHHGAMAREITRFVTAATPAADYITVHTVVGESGKGMTALIKQTGSTTGDEGRAYAASLFEAGAITRLAKAAGKTYGVGVVVMTHGETDADPPNAAYKDQLVQLMADYNADIAAITGQSYKIPMYINQQHAYPNGAASKGKRPDVNNMQWQLGVDHKDNFVCTGPKYQYQANSNGDGVHLSVQGVEMLGEKTAQIYYERAVLGHDWQPLQPIGVERSGRVVTVHFHVPVPPLTWDTTFDAPAITEWKSGQGFELRSATANLTIASVEISGSDVKITASADLPTSGLFVGYALTSQGVQLKNHSKAVRWGQLRDSDTFAGATTKLVNQNYCVSFELPVP